MPIFEFEYDVPKPEPMKPIEQMTKHELALYDLEMKDWEMLADTARSQAKQAHLHILREFVKEQQREEERTKSVLKPEWDQMMRED